MKTLKQTIMIHLLLKKNLICKKNKKLANSMLQFRLTAGEPIYNINK